jgi:hypothetical protein
MVEEAGGAGLPLSDTRDGFASSIDQAYLTKEIYS